MLSRRRVFPFVATMVAMITLTSSEAVKECISNDSIKPASCEEIVNSTGGFWAEVRHLPVPLSFCVSKRYRDLRSSGSCIVHNFQEDSEADGGAKRFVVTSSKLDTKNGQLDDFKSFNFALELNNAKSEKNEDICVVKLKLECKDQEKSTSFVSDWRFKFYEVSDAKKIMVGYTCTDNKNAEEIAQGLLKRHLVFIYARPQIFATKKEFSSLKAQLEIVASDLKRKVKDVEPIQGNGYMELDRYQCRRY